MNAEKTSIFKKPLFWVIIGLLAGLLLAAAVVVLLPCEHRYTQACTLEATCTAEGVLTFTCEKCEESYTEPIPMTEHTLGEPFVSLEATCAAEGKKSVTCTGCNASFETETLPKTDVHTLQYQVLQEATCAAEGQAQNVCTVCAHTEALSIEKKKHTFRDGLSFTGTCVDKGGVEKICTGCGYTYWQEGTTSDQHFYMPYPNGKYVCTLCGRTK